MILWGAGWGALITVWSAYVARLPAAKEADAGYFLAKYGRMLKGKEAVRYVRLLRGWLDEAQWTLRTESYILFHGGLLLIVMAGATKGSSTVVELAFLACVVTNGLLYSGVKRFRSQLRQELGEIQELFLVQLEMGTSLDMLFQYASEMVDGPLQKIFERIALAISTRQDYRAEIMKLREMTGQIETVTFSFILERYLDSGSAQQSMEGLAKSVEQYRLYRREIRRQASYAKLVISGVVMIGSVVLITVVPSVIEAIANIQQTFQ